jgi:hypothetical protein
MQFPPWFALLAVLAFSLWAVGFLRRSTRASAKVPEEYPQEVGSPAKTTRQPCASETSQYAPTTPVDDVVPADVPLSVLFDPQKLIDELKGYQSGYLWLVSEA